jgi:hypothetical protein
MKLGGAEAELQPVQRQPSSAQLHVIPAVRNYTTSVPVPWSRHSTSNHAMDYRSLMSILLLHGSTKIQAHSEKE